MSIQSYILETKTGISYDKYPKIFVQLCISVASAPRAPAAPDRFDTTHVTSSSKKISFIYSDKYYYSSEAAHVGSSASSTYMLGCFSQRTSTTTHLVLVQILSGRGHPPLSLSVSQWISLLRFLDSIILHNSCSQTSSASSYLISYLFLVASSASAYPTRPGLTPLSYRSIGMVIRVQISLVHQMSNFFVIITW